MKSRKIVIFLLIALATQAILGTEGTSEGGSDEDGETTSAQCNSNAIQTLLTSNNAQRKENDSEDDYDDLTISSTPATSGWDGNGICGKIWTDAKGTCCKQDQIKTRADLLIEKLKKRMSGRYDAMEKGKDKILEKLNDIETKLNAQISTMNGNSLEYSQSMTSTITKLKTTTTENENEEKEATQKMGACIKALAEYRVKVWCTACAATGSSVLNTSNAFTGSKLNVDSNTCSDLVEKCGEVMAYFRRIREGDRILR